MVHALTGIIFNAFTRHRDGTDAAPTAPQEWDSHQHQDGPPGNPDEDNPKIAAADWRPEQSGEDCQQESCQGDKHEAELRPAASQGDFDERVSKDVHNQ